VEASHRVKQGHKIGELACSSHLSGN